MNAPVPGLHFFSLEDGGLLFHEGRQRFYGLNGPASYCWLALAEGLGEAAGLAELAAAGIAGQAARDWWDRSLAMFRAEGLLAGADASAAEPPPPPAKGLIAGERLTQIPALPHVRHCRVLGREFRIGFMSAAALARVAGLLSPLPRSEATKVDFEIAAIEDGDRLKIARDRVVVTIATDWGRLAARLETALLMSAIDATEHLLALHSGVAQRGGCGLMLPGVSGSGKSTLVAALAASGWSYGTDEAALLRGGEHILCAPLAACIKAGSWPVLAEFYPRLMEEPVQTRSWQPVRYLPPAGSTIEGCRVTDVVFPRRGGQDAAAELRAVDRGLGMERLLAECISVPRRIGAEEAARLVDWARDITFHELSYGALPGALARLNELASIRSY
jgi:hypothetical protein